MNRQLRMIGIVLSLVLLLGNSWVLAVDSEILDLIETEMNKYPACANLPQIRATLAEELQASDFDGLSTAEITATVSQLFARVREEHREYVKVRANEFGKLVSGALRLRNHGYSSEELDEFFDEVAGDQQFTQERITAMVRKRVENRTNESNNLSEQDRQQVRDQEQIQAHRHVQDQESVQDQEPVQDQDQVQEQKREQKGKHN